MSQSFVVLKCFNCEIFQVHVAKKSKKWICKLCNAKQSIMTVFGEGSGSDCRQHVQKLNLLRGQQGDNVIHLEQLSMQCTESTTSEHNDNIIDVPDVLSGINQDDVNNDSGKKCSSPVSNSHQPQPPKSKWSKYLD